MLTHTHRFLWLRHLRFCHFSWPTHSVLKAARTHAHTHTHAQLPFYDLLHFVRYYPGEPVPEPIWIILKQETVSGSGINWAICKSAPRPRQITMPASHHTVFTGLMPFLPPNQQHQSTEGTFKAQQKYFNWLVILGEISWLIAENSELPYHGSYCMQMTWLW